MRMTVQRLRPAVACAAVAVALAAPQASAVVPTPTQEPPLLGWLDEAVRSRDVSCSTAVTGAWRDASGEVLEERLDCNVQMTDAMAGGHLTADVTMTFTPAASMAGVWSGVFAITAGGGGWKGEGRGAAVRRPGAAAPALYGVVDYRGSGGRVGLDYHQLIAGDGTPTSLSGWIDGPLVPDPYVRLASLGSLRVDAVTIGELP